MASGGKHALEYLASAKPAMLRAWGHTAGAGWAAAQHLRPVAADAGNRVEIHEDETAAHAHDVARLMRASYCTQELWRRQRAELQHLTLMSPCTMLQAWKQPRQVATLRAIALMPSWLASERSVCPSFSKT